MPKNSLTNEQIEDLVVKAQNADIDAFGKLYDHFIDQIYRYVYFKVGKDEALDLTENVFLKTWENLKSYRKGDKQFSSWLFRIAHNVVVDHYRLSKESLSLDMDLPDNKRQNDPIVLTEQKLGSESLRKAIGKLKKKYQQIIILKYINELENYEIARVMHRSEGSLRILKFRALKALKQILENMNVNY